MRKPAPCTTSGAGFAFLPPASEEGGYVGRDEEPKRMKTLAKIS
jgi:hypothetical protein